MKFASYLPSSKFSSIVLSIALAAGLIVAAQYVTAPTSNNSVLSTATANPPTEWEKTLAEVQDETDGLPPPIDPNAVQSLLTEAQSDNITSSVARRLFVNITAAGSEGLGSDIPTQEKLIADAASYAKTQKSSLYSSNDFEVAAATPEATKQWGNAVMQTFRRNTQANSGEVLYSLGYALDYQDTARLNSLSVRSKAYATLAEELITIPVPQTYLPLYLKLVNNLSSMSSSVEEMTYILTDPLRGLSGLQTFQSSGGEASRVLTTLAEQLRKGGILFTKDEAGSDWASFLVSP